MPAVWHSGSSHSSLEQPNDLAGQQAQQMHHYRNKGTSNKPPSSSETPPPVPLKDSKYLPGMRKLQVHQAQDSAYPVVPQLRSKAETARNPGKPKPVHVDHLADHAAGPSIRRPKVSNPPRGPRISMPADSDGLSQHPITTAQPARQPQLAPAPARVRDGPEPRMRKPSGGMLVISTNQSGRYDLGTVTPIARYASPLSPNDAFCAVEVPQRPSPPAAAKAWLRDPAPLYTNLPLSSTVPAEAAKPRRKRLVFQNLRKDGTTMPPPAPDRPVRRDPAIFVNLRAGQAPPQQPRRDSRDDPAQPSTPGRFLRKLSGMMFPDDRDDDPDRPRRGSLTQRVFSAVRRVSHDISHAAAVIGMDKTQRADYVGARIAPQAEDGHTIKTQASQRSEERETKRQAHPLTRPHFQKAAVLAKNLQQHPLPHGTNLIESDYQAMVEHARHQQRLADHDRAAHERACAAAELEGKPRPRSPAASEHIADLTLTAAERIQARAAFAASDLKHEVDAETPPVLPPITLPTATKALVKVSAGLDKLKIGAKGKSARKSSKDSDLDFADCLTADAAGKLMDQRCKECHRFPTGYLRSDGRCTECAENHRMAFLEAWPVAMVAPPPVNTDRLDVPTSRQISTKGIDPDSPPYINVAGAKKLRKLRKTIYAGNPFATDEQETDQVSLFSIPFRTVTFPKEIGSKTGSRDSRLLHGTLFDDVVESPAVLEQAEAPEPMHAILHAPVPLRHGRPVIVNGRHRSKSFTVVPETVSKADGEGEAEQPSAPDPASDEPSNVRDTMFYDFYDELLPDYDEKRESGWWGGG
ncbi:hypothetical protein LTR53_005826 [Teratosphaeriaceae sp. CCFEE 6253]|nr:hypothetical protein LTR53_005826 [Teratosphaeriaceae sp. CCFEE 6253]